uniref:Uncharacterized protein n=1 Tax=Leptobrachium leishanense TaxID=445787 RepID=A0A8C5PUC0_9ANUR
MPLHPALCSYALVFRSDCTLQANFKKMRKDYSCPLFIYSATYSAGLYKISVQGVDTLLYHTWMNCFRGSLFPRELTI